MSNTSAADPSTSNPPPDLHAFGDRKWFWPRKSELQVFFMDGSKKSANYILEVASTWSPHADITFVQTDNISKSDIRVTFKGEGCWSKMGNQAAKCVGQATMCFGGIANAFEFLENASNVIEIRRKVLHEFGHALGLEHEVRALHIALSLYMIYKSSINLHFFVFFL